MNNYQHKSFQLNNILTEEQIDFFNEHGILHFKNLSAGRPLILLPVKLIKYNRD